ARRPSRRWTSSSDTRKAPSSPARQPGRGGLLSFQGVSDSGALKRACGTKKAPSPRPVKGRERGQFVLTVDVRRGFLQQVAALLELVRDFLVDHLQLPVQLVDRVENDRHAEDSESDCADSENRREGGHLLVRGHLPLRASAAEQAEDDGQS